MRGVDSAPHYIGQRKRNEERTHRCRLETLVAIHHPLWRPEGCGDGVLEIKVTFAVSRDHSSGISRSQDTFEGEYEEWDKVEDDRCQRERSAGVGYTRRW